MKIHVEQTAGQRVEAGKLTLLVTNESRSLDPDPVRVTFTDPRIGGTTLAATFRVAFWWSIPFGTMAIIVAGYNCFDLDSMGVWGELVIGVPLNIGAIMHAFLPYMDSVLDQRMPP